jgi:site-specific DNA recombinase
MASVTFIPAKRQVGNNISKEEAPKLRVAAYCRVSTDSDEQETSYDAQVSHYTEYIHGSWQVFLRTTVSPAPTLKSVKNSTA